MKQIQGGVCAAKGFTASGIHCGIRKNKTKKDLALIYTPQRAAAAAVYTTNLVKGAPITVTKANIADGYAQAMLCNSGNANTCNADGVMIAEAMCAHLAEELKISAKDVIVASTGVIGQRLDITPIAQGIPALVSALGDCSADAAEGIMTTDTKRKEIAFSFEAGGKTCRIGGIAKGSGMIHPNMATMLVFLTTDVAIAPAFLQKALQEDVKTSFNRVSVDGDTSTNDTLLVLANGDLDALPAHLHPIAPDNLCLEVYDAFFPLAQQRQHPLSLTLPEDSVPSIEADPDRVKQLLAILLNNAFDHTPAGTPVELCLTYCGEKITLAVQDHGPGIPDAEKARVFDRFYSADPSRTDKHNFGLGLSVAKELARLHHADLTVTDTPGGGAKFAVTFAARIS